MEFAAEWRRSYLAGYGVFRGVRVPARRRLISIFTIRRIMDVTASSECGNIMGQVSSPMFQKTTNFQNGLKLGIGAAFNPARAQRAVFYTCVVNRTKVNSGSRLGKQAFDIASHALSDIAHWVAVPVQRRFFPRALVVRQSARPARRRARRNSRRARGKSAAN
jgi:hypothetical protein